MNRYLVFLGLVLLLGCKSIIVFTDSDIQNCLYDDIGFLYDDSLGICEQGMRLGQENMILFFENVIFEKKINKFSSNIKITDLAVEEAIPNVSFRKGFFDGEIIFDRGEISLSDTNGIMQVNLIIDDSCNVIYFTHPAYVVKIFKVNQKGFCK